MLEKIQQILKQYWGYDTFRPLQADIVLSVLTGHDTLALLPTGGGKSICFQVPAMALEGICVVVTPLIALMQDQVAQLKRRGISAVALYAGMHPNQLDIALDNCIYGEVKFLYVSPERLQSQLFLARAKQMKIALVAIDEAHCISQWGYDFRPPYLHIAEFKALFPSAKLIALTATATTEVKTDIIEKLMMQNPAVFQQSFARDNLSYTALLEENKEQRLLQMLQKIQGTAIVYVRNRRKTQEIATWLQAKGITATFYHAGLTTQERTQRQQAWIDNRIRVMVATNAFGMGIDKPDVRLVVHIDLPETLEAYYQEAGRAGRDSQKAFAVQLYHLGDLEQLEQHVFQQYPSVDFVKKVYQSLGNYYQLATGSGEMACFDLDLMALQQKFQLPTTDTFFALKILENQGFISLSEAVFHPSKIWLQLDNRQLYDFQLRNPSYDAFIKLLLRVYGGEVFAGYVVINEAQLSKAFSMPVGHVERMLEQLEKFDILKYDKQKNKPQLTFLTPRFDASRLPIDLSTLTQRKNKALSKAQAVKHYVTHQKRCRTQLLLEYFDEITSRTCGVCDICVQQKRQLDKRQQVQEKILALLADGAMQVQLLYKIVGLHDEKAFQAIIREMLEEQLLSYQPDGSLGKR